MSTSINILWENLNRNDFSPRTTKKKKILKHVYFFPSKDLTSALFLVYKSSFFFSLLEPSCIACLKIIYVKLYSDTKMNKKAELRLKKIGIQRLWWLLSMPTAFCRLHMSKIWLLQNRQVFLGDEKKTPWRKFLSSHRSINVNQLKIKKRRVMQARDGKSTRKLTVCVLE